MIKRWLITFGVAWLLGCVVTVLVAWSLVLQSQPEPAIFEAPGALAWPQSPPADWPNSYTMRVHYRDSSWLYGVDHHVFISGQDRYSPTHQMLVSRAGWPCWAFQSTVLAVAKNEAYGECVLIPSEVTWGSGIRLPAHRSRPTLDFAGLGFSSPLPMSILPLGFVVNSSVAAGLLLIPITLFRYVASSVCSDRRSVRRGAARFVVSMLAVGSLASVAIALGLWTRYTPLLRLVTLLVDIDQSGRLSSDASWPAPPPPGWPTHPTAWDSLGSTLGVRVCEFSGPSYFISRSRYSESAKAVVTSVGWPVHCMESVEFVSISGARESAPCCIVLDALIRRDCVLPTRPIGLGLLANTLFYAYLIALPMLSIRAVRVVRRRRRGACESCGYSRAGLDASAACPECGTIVQTRRTS